MSRLIDADTCKCAIHKYANEPVKLNDRRWDTRCTAIIADVNGIIDAAPTIDAIPVEWLKKYQLENEKQGSYDMVGAIEVTLWDWEKKQEVTA